MDAKHSDPHAITVDFIYEAAARCGAKIPSSQYPVMLLGQARGYLVAWLLDLGKRQNPAYPISPVMCFNKLNPNLRELLGVRSVARKMRKPIGGDGSIALEERDVTSHEPALVHLPTHQLKAVLQQRKDQPYEVMAFVSDEIVQFAAPESDDPTILCALSVAESLVPAATLDREALMHAKPYRHADQLVFKTYWDGEEGKLGPADYAFDKENAANLLPYLFLSVELRHALTLFGKEPVNVAEADLANGAHQLHFWGNYTRLVLHWDTKPDVSDLIAQHEAKRAEHNAKFGQRDRLLTDAEAAEQWRKFSEGMQLE